MYSRWKKENGFHIFDEIDSSEVDLWPLGNDINNKDEIKNVLKEKVTKCDFCKYSAFAKYRMKAHVIEQHDQIKSQKCDHCSYCAHDKHTLKSHIFHNHERNGAYECKHCGY